MGKHVGKPVTVWFDIDTLNQLDLHLEKLAADCPGMKPSRSAFIQLAVMRSLAGRGEPAERPAREVEINYSGPDAERALKEAQAGKRQREPASTGATTAGLPCAMTAAPIPWVLSV